MIAAYIDGGLVRLTIQDGESLSLAAASEGDSGFVLGPGQYDAAPRAGLKIWDAIVAAGISVAPSTTAPDCPSLPWWRTALKLWMRPDGSGASISRYADVDAAIKALETAAKADGSADVSTQRIGILAREQFEYANSVLLADLLKLAPAFGFTASDCSESLWRADRVRLGDLTGAWPLPASA